MQDAIQLISNAVRQAWPAHAPFLDNRFTDQEESLRIMSETIADLILRLTGNDLPLYCENYKWMCEKILQEELFFRKHGRYRLSSQKDAYDTIYNQPDYMSRYISGLLLSQLLWKNQTSVIDFFCNRFLNGAGTGGNYLEIGPGHGLFLYFADACRKFNTITAWDISESSLKATRHALDRLGAGKDIALETGDVTVPHTVSGQYSEVVISEVLEHLDDPKSVLENLYRVMQPGGRIFANIPVNSPAPDHIFLWDTPELFFDLVAACGFKILETSLLPMTGYTLDRARARKLTINTCVIAQKPSGS